MSKKPKVIDHLQAHHYDALVRKVLKYSYDVYSMADLKTFLDKTLPGLTEGDLAPEPGTDLVCWIQEGNSLDLRLCLR
jgi:hypothetical protein